jgi:hypothetical protein
VISVLIMVMVTPYETSMGRRRRRRLAFVTALLVVVLLPSTTLGHGYLKTPRSRNYVAYQDGVWWPVSNDGPAPESEPQSANIGGTQARCGIIGGNRNYDTPKNAMGNLLPPKPQQCYQPNQIIDLEVTLTAHHKGHFEFKACPINPGDVPTQSCFDAHPLTFIADILSPGESRAVANFDPNYPERAYIPLTDMELHYKYQLPNGLSGDLILLQWHYVTANSCTHVGYDQYNWPIGFHPGNVPTCGPLPPDGNGVPEQVR